MILGFSDFKVEAKIPGLLAATPTSSPHNTIVQEVVRSYIEKYEPLFLRQFFDTADEIASIEEYASLPADQRTDEDKNELLADLKKSLSHYVAFYYFRSQTNTPIGAVKLQGDNGERVSFTETLVLLWNQMVDNNVFIRKSLLSKNDVKKNDIFIKINTFGF